MGRRQLAWLGGIGLSLVYLLVAAALAYDTNALGVATSRLIRAVAWALAIVAALASTLGLAAAIKKSSTSLVFRVLNTLAGRLATIGASLVLGTVLLVLALRVEVVPTWSCEIQSGSIAAPHPSRCPADAVFAQMRSFQIRLARRTDPPAIPTLRASARDRAASSVAIDSDRGGLCVGTGPDHPTKGESRLALSPDCGADRTYVVKVHLCDVRAVGRAAPAELHAAVKLEIFEGTHADTITCH